VIRLILLWLVAWLALEAMEQGWDALGVTSWIVLSLVVLTYPPKEDR